MHIGRPIVADTSAASRSRLTNHKDLLPGVDGRSPIARRYRVRESEQLEAQIVNGEAVSVEDLVKLVNGQNRTFASIGLRRRARDVTPSLQDYIEGRAS